MMSEDETRETTNDLKPEIVEAIRKAAKQARDPWMQRALSAADYIFEALERHNLETARLRAENDEWREIGRALDTWGIGGLLPLEYVERARALLKGPDGNG